MAGKPAVRRLPRLNPRIESPRLPLPQQTATQLAAALLLDELQLRQRSLLPLLKDDAALAVWAVCRLQAVCDAVPQSAEHLAELFAQYAVRLLQYDDDELPAGECDDEELRDKARELAGDSVTCAHRAAELAQQAGCDAATIKRAYLLGLLQSATGWIELCSGGPKTSPWLPGWLVDELSAIDGACSDNPAAGFVAQAKSHQAEAAQDADAAQTCRAARDARRRWDASTDGSAAAVADSLPQLARKLARLDELQNHFDETLLRAKIESLYHFAYGASHEFNNPLANISSRAQLLLRDEHDHRRREMLASINAQAFRGHEMILNVMHFARPPQPACEPVDLADLIDRVAAELVDEAQQQGTALVCVPNEQSVIALVDPEHIATALRALCVNALEAVGVGGRIEIRLQLRSDAEHDEPEMAEVTVHDTGPGIPEEMRGRLFDPFYSGREAGRGLGFGLSKCWRIVTMHGGRIDVQSDAGGSVFAMRLPLASAPRQQKAAS